MKGNRISNSFNSRGKGLCLFDFIRNARFFAPDFPGDITAKVQEQMKDLHPSMIIGGGVLKLDVFIVQYSYQTVRYNQRTNQKYIFFTKGVLPAEPYERDLIVEAEFHKWVDSFNREKPFRSMSNVEILGIEYYAQGTLAIG